MAGFALASIKRAIHPVSIVAGFLSLPLLWTLFLGQLEGIVLVGSFKADSLACSSCISKTTGGNFCVWSKKKIPFGCCCFLS